jgi:hypothetical protein
VHQSNLSVFHRGDYKKGEVELSMTSTVLLKMAFSLRCFTFFK